jgi:hypothetical protein
VAGLSNSELWPPARGSRVSDGESELLAANGSVTYIEGAGARVTGGDPDERATMRETGAAVSGMSAREGIAPTWTAGGTRWIAGGLVTGASRFVIGTAGRSATPGAAWRVTLVAGGQGSGDPCVATVCGGNVGRTATVAGTPSVAGSASGVRAAMPIVVATGSRDSQRRGRHVDCADEAHKADDERDCADDDRRPPDRRSAVLAVDVIVARRGFTDGGSGRGVRAGRADR